MERHAISLEWTPILNTPDFQGLFSKKLPLDKQNLMRHLEFIAFSETKFHILEENHGIYRVKTSEYVGDQLFLHKAFVKLVGANHPERSKSIPSTAQMLEALPTYVGSRYIWGGNVKGGLNKFKKLYPPTYALNPLEEDSWIFNGVDCSGLLYQVSGGCTPRNTSELAHFGQRIEDLDARRPLDLILYEGHVLIVLDRKHVIESKCEMGGVVIQDYQKRFEQMQEEGRIIQLRRWQATLS